MCVLAWMIYMKFNLCKCIRWLSVQYNNKKLHFGFYSTNGLVFIQLIRWARCDLYYIFYFNWQISAKKKKKKKKLHGSGREWESFFREWTGTGFSPSFFVGLGREEIHFCGSGMGEVWEFTPVSPSKRHVITSCTFSFLLSSCGNTCLWWRRSSVCK